MARDPFAAVPTRARLAVAALLAAGLPATHGFGWAAGDAGSDAPVHLLVRLAALCLVLVAVRRRTPATRRLARAATTALTAALAVALGRHCPLATLVLAVALLLAAPPLWRRPEGARFGSWQLRG